MPESIAGDSIATALAVGPLTPTVKQYRSWAGAPPADPDPYDFYRIRLTASSVLNINIAQETPVVPNSTIIPGKTAVGVQDPAGNTVTFAVAGANGVQTISQRLHAGTYYIKVDNPGPVGSFYQINMSATPDTSGMMYFIDDTREAQVIRLYQAAFGRAPDESGFANWTKTLRDGTPLNDVAAGFLASPEFQARYGANVNDTVFVTNLYQNVLNRAPDAPGLANWLQRLSTGAATRAQVLTGFSESAENKANTPPSPAAGSVARLYYAVLNRPPDQAGLASWTSQVSNGTATLQQEAAGLLASPEFTTRYGALGNQAFVTEIYRNALRREPDAPGLTNWTAQLAGGASRASVVIALSESPESKSALAYLVNQNGIVVA